MRVEEDLASLGGIHEEWIKQPAMRRYARFGARFLH
jgi:hypothetical protein